MNFHRFRSVSVAVLAVFLGIWTAGAGAGDTNTVAGTNAAAMAEGAAAEAALVGAQDTLRSNLQIQSQLHDAQILIEQSRQEAAAAARTAEILNQRLDSLAASLANERMQTLKDIQRSNQDVQHSNQVVLIIAGALAVFSLLVLLFAAFVQWNMVNRVSAVATQLRNMRGLDAGDAVAVLGEGSAPMGPSPALQHSNANFLGLIDRLEKRIQDLTLAQSHQALPEAPVNGGSAASAESGAKEEHAADDGRRTISLLLGKGQTLLKLDQPQAAIECFDEVLSHDSGNADALLKKGAALERLQRLNEAIDCYDRAIASDGSLTMAYLHKGGVFNRMERYTEALECYEQALKTQEKERPADVLAE